MSYDPQASEKSTILSLQVSFLLGRYHGKEWPPSPKRLFLAFVAALHQNSGRVDFQKGYKAMKFFEQIGSPKIYAQGREGREYTIFVPNNDGDVIGKALADGKTPKDPRTLTTSKIMKPHIAETATYVWDVSGSGESEDIAVLCEIAKEIPVLGLGIDPVAVHGSVRDSTDRVANAPCYVADDRGDKPIDVPVEGLLEDAERHHNEFEGRISHDGFYKPAPIRKYHTQKYRKRTPVSDVCMFKICGADGSSGALPNSKIPKIIEQLYKIKNEYGRNDTLEAEVAAIPTIGEHSDGIVRRVAFLISPNTSEKDQDRFVAHVSGQFLDVEGARYQINKEQDDHMSMYRKKSKLWRSVMPVDLGGDGLDVAKSVIGALGKIGITDDVAFVDHRKEAYWNGLPNAAGRATHMEIEFKIARKGMFSIGKNKELGYGLFAPEEIPQAAYFAVVGDRPPVEKTMHVADLVRRAAMSKFHQLFKRSDIPYTISGHSADPLNHSHALWMPHDQDGDGLIDHVAVYARGGFGRAEMQALGKIADIYNDSVRMRVHFKRFRGMHELGQKCKLFEKHNKWKSVTPYYPPRHIKKNHDIKDQVEWEMSEGNLPGDLESVRIDSSPTIEIHKNKKTPVKEFENRRNGKGPTTGMGVSLEINFKKPIRGPLALGYGKHFGLGMFVPIHDKK